MPYEIDDQSIRIVGYYVPIKFYNPSRQLKAEIFLQDDDTLNIGGISSGSIGGTEINITALLDAGFVIVGSDADLSNARSITPGDGIDIVDSGPGGPITILVDVSDFAGSGLEDDGANNLRIAAEAAGDGLAGGSGDPLEVGEGPGVDVTANAVGLGGDTVLLYDSGGDPVAEFAATDGGLTAALAALAAGDVVELPAVTISGGPWTVANGTLRGLSRFGSILDGQVNVETDCVVERLSIIRVEDDVDERVGVNLSAGARVGGCYIDIYNATGDAYGVYSEDEGDCFSNDNIVFAESEAGDGYCFYADGAEMYASGGYCVASTDPVGVS